MTHNIHGEGDATLILKKKQEVKSVHVNLSNKCGLPVDL